MNEIELLKLKLEDIEKAMIKLYAKLRTSEYRNDTSKKEKAQKRYKKLNDEKVSTIKQIKYLINQELLQQQAATEQAEAKARQEEERIRLLKEQLLQERNKTEQEKQKIAQELAKAKVELAKAKLAKTLAEKGGEGNIAASKTLLGTWESKGINPYMIAGITAGSLLFGIIIYKILK